jgi:hypothetical protein
LAVECQRGWDLRALLGTAVLRLDRPAGSGRGWEHRRHDKSGLALIIFAVVAIVFSYTGFAFFATIYDRTLRD